MERSRQDCYFYYYSKCTKEDCQFRHEPAALGCEETCAQWQQGNCVNDRCNFRHMELKKNRKAIPCYWERQPSGCTKPHCSFLHTNATPSGDGPNKAAAPASRADAINEQWRKRCDDVKFDNSGTESDQGRGSSDTGNFIGNQSVDTVIVNFEEGMRLY